MTKIKGMGQTIEEDLEELDEFKEEMEIEIKGLKAKNAKTEQLVETVKLELSQAKKAKPDSEKKREIEDLKRQLADRDTQIK